MGRRGSGAAARPVPTSMAPRYLLCTQCHCDSICSHVISVISNSTDCALLIPYQFPYIVHLTIGSDPVTSFIIPPRLLFYFRMQTCNHQFSFYVVIVAFDFRILYSSNVLGAGCFLCGAILFRSWKICCTQFTYSIQACVSGNGSPTAPCKTIQF